MIARVLSAARPRGGMPPGPRGLAAGLPQGPLLDTAGSPRFACDDPAMLEHLEEQGYVVVRDVLGPAERDGAEALLWDFLGAQAGWERRRPSTWTSESFNRMGQGFRGIINGRGVGQSELSWFVRTRGCVRAAFSLVWGTPDLITSFDGINVYLPWHHGFQKTVGAWYHVDQGRETLGKQCVQGFVSLSDQCPRTGGLVVVPGSHRRHGEVCEAAADAGDFIAVPEGHPVLDMPRRLVSCRAGDLVLWDSRCVHCNTPAVEAPSGPGDELLRSVVYVCMTPRAWASAEDLERRRRGYEVNLTSSHWPHKNVMGFGWARAPRLEYAAAGPERRRLIG